MEEKRIRLQLEAPICPPGLASEAICRYMPLERFKEMLNARAIWFSRADLLGDSLEGSIHPEMRGPLVRMLMQQPQETDDAGLDWPQAMKPFMGGLEEELEAQRQYCFVSCWHASSNETHSMWSVYGGATDCIAITSTVGRLIQAVRPVNLDIEFCDEPSDRIVGFAFAIKRAILVDRVLYGAEPPNTAYHFDQTQFLFRKDAPFEAEREIRALFDLRWTAQEYPGVSHLPGVEIPINPEMLIESVILPPNSSTAYETRIRTILEKSELDLDVKPSSLTEGDRWSWGRQTSVEQLRSLGMKAEQSPDSKSPAAVRLRHFSPETPNRDALEGTIRQAELDEESPQKISALYGLLGLRCAAEEDHYAAMTYFDRATSDGCGLSAIDQLTLSVHRSVQLYWLGYLESAKAALKKQLAALAAEADSHLVHVATATAHQYVGLSERDLDHIDKAGDHLEKAYRVYKDVFGFLHPITTVAMLDWKNIHTATWRITPKSCPDPL